jgi:hypothetical protein
MMLYKLEIMDHKAAEKQGSLVPVLGSPIPVVLTRDSAIEVLTLLCSIISSVFFLLPDKLVKGSD